MLSGCTPENAIRISIKKFFLYKLLYKVYCSMFIKRIQSLPRAAAMNGALLSVLFFIQITIADPLPGQSAFPDIPRPTISTSYNNIASSFLLSNGTQTRSRPPTTTPFTTYPLNLTGDILATHPCGTDAHTII